MEFTFQKRWYGPDGKTMRGGAYNPDVVKESYTFYTVHDAIRFIEKVYRLRERDYGYWNAWSLENDEMRAWKLTDRALWHVIARVKNRHHLFCNYMHNIRDWVTVPNSRVYWADNSIEETERNTVTGATRINQLVAPHGDVC